MSRNSSRICNPRRRLLAFASAVLGFGMFVLVPWSESVHFSRKEFYVEDHHNIIISVVRNETGYVVEWLNYHLWLGFDRVVFYNQDDISDAFKARLRPYIVRGVALVVDATVGDQMGSYMRGIETFGHRVNSVSFLDADEFLVLCNSVSVKEALKSLGRAGVHCGEIKWFQFGTADIVYQDPSTGILDKFLKRQRAPVEAHAGKVILKGGNWLQQISREKWRTAPFWHYCGALTDNFTFFDPREVRINHYTLKQGEASLQERVSRGFHGDFAGQEVYSRTNISEFLGRNEFLDDAFANIKTFFPGMLNPQPPEQTRAEISPRCIACRNALGKTVDRFDDKIISSFQGVNSSTPVHVYLHVVVTGEWKHILLDMLLSMEQYDLISESLFITIGVCGDGTSNVTEFVSSFESRFSMVQVIHVSANPHTWEFGTLNSLLLMARDINKQQMKANFLYMHTKGLHISNGDYVAKWYWRKNLEKWVLGEHRYCRFLLDQGFDTVGINAINQVNLEHASLAQVNPNHAWHYSGNFWWATSTHLAALPLLEIEEEIDEISRCRAENLLLSRMPVMCAGSLHQDLHPHVYQMNQIPTMSLHQSHRNTISIL